MKKMTLQQVADSYGYTSEDIRLIYEKAYKKVKSATELLDEIDVYEQKLKQLQQYFDNNTIEIKKEYKPIDIRLNKKLTESHYPFGKRLFSVFEMMDAYTIGDLAKISVKNFHCYRGFGNHSKKELVKFIEFENIEDLFKGFSAWKKRPFED